MSDNIYHFGFEEADDDWNPPRAHIRPDNESPDEIVDDDALVGCDPDGVVSVVVNEHAAVEAVRMARDWREAVDPRTVHNNMVAAANAASMRALSFQVEQSGDLSAQIEELLRAKDTMPSPGPGGPLSTEDVTRLVDSAFAELDQYLAAVQSTSGQAVSVESRGGHITGSAQQGQILGIQLDAHWVSGALNPEIEAELLEVLRTLRQRSTPSAELAGGPRGKAIDELNQWVQHPRALLARLGMPTTEENHRG